jgi:hypothetical protein
VKKAVRLRHRRELGRWAQVVFEMSERRVSRLLAIQGNPAHYRRPREPVRPFRAG